jgi:hypothetical protein
LFLDFNFKVDDDLHGSDHYPIVLTTNTAEEEDEPHPFKLNSANWSMFFNLTSSKLGVEDVMGSEDPVLTFSNIIIECARQSIPTRSPGVRPPAKPWYDQECKDLRRARKRAQEKVLEHQP